MSDLVGNPEHRFSRVTAHILEMQKLKILRRNFFFFFFLIVAQKIDCEYTLELSQ